MSRPQQALHALGRSRFVDDIPAPSGALHAAVSCSPHPHAGVRGLDTAAALAVEGVVGVLTARDIPGANAIGIVVGDEPLLAEDSVHYAGQPLALVLARNPEQARRGAAAIRLDAEPLPVMADPRRAREEGRLFAPARTFGCGDVEAAWSRCAHVVGGRVACGGQEQLYLETQSSLAIPRDDGSLLIHSSTQNPSGVQAAISRVLGVPMHQVEVDVGRVGGGFGGKESQASAWATLAALGARLSGQAVKLVLRRGEDMRMTGKRHPYQADFRIGLDPEGRILAYEVDFIQNAGAYTDLSLAVLERSLFHANGSYRIPNLRATGWSCRTNLPPFTAMRGFGAPQAAFVIEAAIRRAAGQSGIPAEQIQRLSLLDEDDHFHYGMAAERCQARRCWDQAHQDFGVERWRADVDGYNAAHPLSKKGLALTPICFGISFTHLPLNQGSALVHGYLDGSIGFSTGAVEMGQGVTAKLCRVAAASLGVPLERIRAETTNTTRVANGSASAASVTADLNGKALAKACGALRERLLQVAAEQLSAPVEGLSLKAGRVARAGRPTELSWEALVQSAYERRISLSAQAHYSTPGLEFDTTRQAGHPFAYHVYGTAVTEVRLDCLRGTYRIGPVRILHDAGASLHPEIDRGQVEGAVVQGIGWITSEELIYDAEGRLLTDALATYKIPDGPSSPEIEVRFLSDAAEPAGLLNAKAVGEPPFLYGVGAYTALLDAIGAFRPERDSALDAPLTPERVLMALVG
ncbi:molybdopterin cofactor-binding domain-containing protein [Thiorhodococcus minor]|uniref:Molybdopterin-dependent oxidoreductase n=1 Tax=Thiorhodococcus minor TaxID=57489 RepID=A0A6M0K5Z1_9GAMM|nr:molybdopterin cofactor-binding domain-containing protein [Thiorhodococcus minor]NEV64849.1 molybdopterin-dependent oxidoreductase [Thiorhodococcus minor]